MAQSLQILEGQKQLRKPFAPPVEGQPAQSDDLRRRLSARRRFVPWGGGTANFVPHYLQVAAAADVEEQAVEEADNTCPLQVVAKPSAQQEPEAAPLVLWQPG
jgi:DNA repair and recombination protein RAD54 and RAD54-like protein